MAVYKKTYRRYEGELTSVVEPLPGDPALRLRGPAPVALPHHLLPGQLPLSADLRAHHLRAAQRQRAQPARRAERQPADLHQRHLLPELPGLAEHAGALPGAFIGPGQVSPDLANNALPLYLARPFSRVEYVLGKMSVLLVLHVADDLGARPAAVLPAGATWKGWTWMHDNCAASPAACSSAPGSGSWCWRCWRWRSPPG